ncbi:MAG: lipid kinase [Arachnia propionica]|nr:MAG: lipid kinase [Arachnia propionica]
MSELAKPRLITVIANKQSGNGKAGRALPKIARRLHRELPDAEISIVTSKSYQDAENLTRTAALAAREGDAVVVIGGDGMAHLGVNACANTAATLGIIPVGTGNDFARGVGVPTAIDAAVTTIAEGYARVVDLAHISNSRFGQRYVGAVVSTGYDARVNRATNNSRIQFGALSYGYLALRELAAFQPLRYRLRIDGVERRIQAMLVAIANTGLFGGGMQIAPDANPADGLLDITIIHPTSRVTLLRMLPTIYSGGFVGHPAVERLQAHEVSVEGSELFVMGDGEELGEVPVSVRAAAGCLSIFVAS